MPVTRTPSLRPLFTPRSVVVVGASRETKKIGHIVLENIISGGFTGKIYAVNPHASSIGPVPCYADIDALPVAPDLAVLAIPAEGVLPAVEALGKKGTKHIIILSAGFKEAGREGEDREHLLAALADVYGLLLLGPNCLGLLSRSGHLNATFAKDFAVDGNVRCIVQSGAIASSFLDWTAGQGIGFSDMVTLGNKTVIGENDILRHWQSHESLFDFAPGSSRYRPIAMYLESFQDGRACMSLISFHSKRDPVIVLKPGRSFGAQAAMRSHTGALAGEDAVVDAALKQAGAIRARGVEDLFDLIKASAWENAPEGPGVAVISNAGGPAVLSADSIADEGLILAPIDGRTKRRLREILPRSASVLNPIDVLGDALSERYAKALELVLGQQHVHAVLVILTPQVMTEITATAEAIGRLSRKYNKPIFCAFMGGSEIVAGEKILNAYRIPSYRYPERAVAVMGALWRWREWQKKEVGPGKSKRGSEVKRSKKGYEEVRALILQAIKQRQKALSSEVSQQVLALANIPVPAMRLVSHPDQAKDFAVSYGFPVALKISGEELQHKTDVRGVIAHIRSQKELDTAYLELQKTMNRLSLSKRAHIMIQEHVDDGVEVIVSVTRDPVFGPTFLVGSGGTRTELYHDRAMRVGPLTKEDIRTLVAETHIGTILTGYRGRRFAVEKLYQLIVLLETLMTHLPEVMQIEINPVIVTNDAAFAVDGKITLRYDHH